MKNLYLDPTTNDLTLKNFNLRVTSNNTEWLSQKIENIFKTFAGEWFMDYTIGLDHFGKVLKKNVDINEVNSLYLNALKDIRGVDEILEFTTDYDNALRTYNIKLKVSTDEGEILETTFEI